MEGAPDGAFYVAKDAAHAEICRLIALDAKRPDLTIITLDDLPMRASGKRPYLIFDHETWQAAIEAHGNVRGVVWHLQAMTEYCGQEVVKG